MKLKELQDAMIAAMKAKDKFRKDAIASLVSAVKKKGIDAGCREDIPDDMANEAIQSKSRLIHALLTGQSCSKSIRKDMIL